MSIRRHAADWRAERYPSHVPKSQERAPILEERDILGPSRASIQDRRYSQMR